MLFFEKLSNQNFYHIEEIINSNPDYNLLENGSPSRTEEEIKEEYIYENSNRHTYLIKLQSNYIGIVDYLDRNPNDGHTWLGLLMIHGKYHKHGYGKKAYKVFEKLIQEKRCTNLRLGVIPKNHTAEEFWESIGFEFYEQKKSTAGIMVNCYEKKLGKI